MLDTDFAIQRIIESGIQETQARAIVRQIVDAQVDLVSKRDLSEAVTGIKAAIAEVNNAVVMLDKINGLKFAGLYGLMLIVACGVAKLVFWGLS